MSDESAFQTQYARGPGWVRCVRCDCPRRTVETVVADGKRVCKDSNDCSRLSVARNKAARAHEAGRKLPEPDADELAATPIFWNQSGAV